MEVENRQDHGPAAGLGDDQLKRPPGSTLLLGTMKRISENGARPVSALGEPLAQPFGRLGALVFQPITRIRLCWASLRAQTRIAGCAQVKLLPTPAGKTFSSENRCPISTAPSALPAIGAARGYGSGWGRQGIARHVPPCPAALHLDCPNLRQKCAAKDCWRRSARNEKNTSR